MCSAGKNGWYVRNLNLFAIKENCDEASVCIIYYHQPLFTIAIVNGNLICDEIAA